MAEKFVTDEATFSEPSLQKQLLFTKYATGQLTWAALANEVAKIRPPLPVRPWRQRLAIALIAFVAAILIPPWARREN